MINEYLFIICIYDAALFALPDSVIHLQYSPFSNKSLFMREVDY